MGKINPKLLDQLQKKLKIKRAQAYTLISRKAGETFLPPDLAVIALAAEKGINISRYATPEQLAQIRTVGPTGIASVQTVAPIPTKKSPPFRRKKKEASDTSSRRRGTSVFVVHGRNERASTSLFRFLRSVGLHPIEWEEAILLTGKPSPQISEILDTAFREAVAVIILLSPDDEARLKPKFLKRSDPPHEKELSGQPRANVLFEAGMAFGRNPEGTILVQVGDVRPFSDVAGRHVVHLSNSTQKRQEFLIKLANAGCYINTSGVLWHTEGDFILD